MHAVPNSELHALNFRFLLLASQAAKADPDSANRVFGIAHEDIAVLAGLSIDQLTDLSKTNALVFKGRVNGSLVSFAQRAQSPALRAAVIEASGSPAFA